MKHLVVALLFLSFTAAAHAQLADHRIVLPLPIGELPGQHGSQWRTELAIRNTGPEEVKLLNSNSECRVTCPIGEFRIAPNTTLILSPANSPTYSEPQILRVAPGTTPTSPAEWLRFQFRAHDVSRRTDNWGVEIPVLRPSAFIGNESVHLLNIPADARYRHLIRVYAVDATAPVRVRLIARATATGALLKDATIELAAAPEFEERWTPAYAPLSDVISPTEASAFDIELRAVDQVTPIWAFASVTNNETQHVSVVTPQPVQR